MMRLAKAAKIVEDGYADALSYYSFPEEHWVKIRTNNVTGRVEMAHSWSGSDGPHHIVISPEASGETALSPMAPKQGGRRRKGCLGASYPDRVLAKALAQMVTPSRRVGHSNPTTGGTLCPTADTTASSGS